MSSIVGHDLIKRLNYITCNNNIIGECYALNKKIILILFIIVLSLFIFSSSWNSSNENKGNWSYNKNEYPLDEYTLENIPVSHKSAAEVRQFFSDADTDKDGKLRGEEISAFDYKVKHSQFTFNGPYGYN